MRNSEIDSPKRPHSFLYRVLRAVVIGFIIYYSLGFLYMCSHVDANKFRQGMIDNINNRKDDQEPFVAWNGKAPTTLQELQRKVGYEWAEANHVNKHALCRERWVGNHKVYEKGGCNIYVTKVNVTDVIRKMPPLKKHYDSTAECFAARNTRWDLILNDMRELGDGYAASVTAGKRAGPDVAECDNIDNTRIVSVVYEPQIRLTEIMGRVRNGGVLSDEDRQTIQKDYPGVESFPAGHSSYREEYLTEAEDLFKIAGGKEYVLGKVKVANIPDLETLNKLTVSCEDYRTKIKSFKAKDAEIVENEAKVERYSQEWQNLNQARVANMNTWGIMTADAKASQCEIE